MVPLCPFPVLSDLPASRPAPEAVCICGVSLWQDPAGGWVDLDHGTYACGRGTNEQHRPRS